MKIGRTAGQVALPLATAVIVAVAVVVVGGGGGSVGYAEPVAQPSPVNAGQTLYLRDCAFCHGSRGEGTPVAPPVRDSGAMAADFYLSTGRMPEARPIDDPPRRPPAYDRQQIDQLVAYVASLGQGPPIPTVNPAAGDLGEGAELYALNCAACHSSAGIGGALTQGKEAPSILTATPTEIAEALRLGGTGNMPVFGSDVFDQRQLDSLVRYVRTLQHPQDRGGLPLGHIGPIAEGFIAWAVGLLLLVVFVRWTGTRAKE
jgi:ubiquinol-cytochrome c reductase cytochrome c subunit